MIAVEHRRYAPLLVCMVAIAGCSATQSAGDLVAINIAVEPDVVMADAAVAANARLRERDPASFALDAGHHPHLTVLQRYVGRASLADVERAVSHAARESGIAGRELTATGLYATPFAGLGMASIRVTATPELRAFQEALIEALAPFVVAGGDANAFVPEPGGAINQATLDYVRDFVPDSSGARYNPHVTVGVGEPARIGEFVAGPFTAFPFRVQAVSIFQLGNFGTARRRLWTAADE